MAVPGFDAEVRASGRGSHAVVVPKALANGLGTRRVVARIGDESFETTLGAYGGRTFLGLRASLLSALGLAAGDTVHVDLAPGAPVEPPQAEPRATTCTELEAGLVDDALFREAWEALPHGHRDEYGRWISVGEDPQTRRSRIERLRRRLLPT